MQLFEIACGTLLALLCYRIFSKFNHVTSDGPWACTVPRTLLFHTAFVALAAPEDFLRFQWGTCHQPVWAMALFGLAFCACATLGALFFAFDTSWFPSCNWAVTRRTCTARPFSWSLKCGIALAVLFGVAAVANNVLTALLATGVLDLNSDLPCVFRVPPSPIQGALGFGLLQAGWLAWVLGVPLLFWRLYRAAPQRIHWHMHHYGIALFVGVSVRGATLVSFLVLGAAWGVFLQGCWAAYTEFLLEPVGGGTRFFG